MQTITPKIGSTEGLDLTPAVFTAKNGKSYYLIDARTGLAAAVWQMKNSYRALEGAFRDQFNPKRKSGSWRVQEVTA
jgi:hypothetical protein